MTRLGAADAVPAPDPAWKSRVVADAPRRRTSERGLRVALVAVALAELADTLGILVFGRVDAIRDQGAMDVALAISLLVVAWRPWRAAGLQTFLGIAALLLVATELVSLLGGGGDVFDLGRHFVVLASWLIVRALAGLVPQVSPASQARAGGLRRRRSWPALGTPPSTPAAGERMLSQPAGDAGAGERREVA